MAGRGATYAGAGALAAVCVLVAASQARAHGSDYGDPADPNSTTAPLFFRAAVERDRAVDERRVAWRELFDAAGEPRPDPPLAVRKPDPDANAHGRGGHGGGRAVTTKPSTGPR